MRKSFASALFIVFAILALAVPASAQIRWGYIPQTWDGWYYKIQGNQVGMLTADNLGMVSDLTDQLRRSEFRSLREDLRWNGMAYGLPMAGGGFYPMYDRQMRPMGRREATVTYGAIGAGIGYGVSGDLRGTMIGAAGGAILGLLTHRGNCNNNQHDSNNVVVTPPYQNREDVRVGPDGIPVAIGTRPYAMQEAPVRPVIEKRSGEFTLSNSTRFKMDVYDGETGKEGNFKFRLAPGEKRGVDAPGDRYRGLALVPNIHGNISTEEFGVSPTDAGWIFIEPDVMRRK